jgi:hypothetical protein
MTSAALTIARTTFVEAVRQPIFLGLLLVAGLLQVLNTWITGFTMGMSRVAGEVTGDNKLLLDVGLSTVFVCGILLAAFVATAAVSREIENRTILTVVSKPVPRVAVVVGKYLGVAGAMLVAVYLMILFMLLGIRHGVLSTAADDPDMPVIYFSLIAVFGSLILAGVGNYMYGWSFGQTAVLLMVPLTTLAYLGVLLLSKKWAFQPILTDFKPQITLAAVAVAMALLVMSAIAVAASTRLGQVMTITVCAGVFLLGLLSNSFFGRRAFVNTPVAVIADTAPGQVDREAFDRPGDTYRVTLKQAPRDELFVGQPVWWGPAPNGVGMSVADFAPPPPGLRLADDRFPPGTPSSVVITAINDLTLTLKQVGAEGVPVKAAPQPQDFLFVRTTGTRPAALAAWSIVPNLQTFWLVDAVNRVEPIPLAHMGLIGLYSLCQIAAALAVATMLFQGRDVG